MLGSTNIGLAGEISRFSYGALWQQYRPCLFIGTKKAHQFAVLCMYALHKGYSLQISPSICAFNECIAATPQLAFYHCLLSPFSQHGRLWSTRVLSQCISALLWLCRDALLLTKKEASSGVVVELPVLLGPLRAGGSSIFRPGR